MKRACVMFLLGVGWLAAQTITFSGPTLTPTKLPACAGTPGPVTQTATYD